MRKFLVGGMWKNCVDYAVNTMDYKEISTVNKIDSKAFPMYRTAVKQKALQSLAHNLSYLLNIMPANCDICLICF